jgi:hypothetical protein
VKTLRMLLFLPGAAALVWGVMLFADFAFPLRPDSFFTLGWLLGGPLLHDGVIAPTVGLLGLAVSRFVPRAWKTPVVVGSVLSGVLAVLAVPLLWRAYGAPRPPGPHKDVGRGLLVSLAVVWAGVLLRRITRHFSPGKRTACDRKRGDPVTRGWHRPKGERAGVGLGRTRRPSVRWA